MCCQVISRIVPFVGFDESDRFPANVRRDFRDGSFSLGMILGMIASIDKYITIAERERSELPREFISRNIRDTA